MAEAHQAVSYAELVNIEPSDVSPERELLRLIWKSGVRAWKKRVGRFKNKIRNAIYPAHFESVWIILIMVLAVHYEDRKVPFDLVNTLNGFWPGSNVIWQLISCVLVGLFYWILYCVAMRLTLRILLLYKGFMFESRGKDITLKTKVWGFLMKTFIKWNPPTLYSFQETLPCLPLPSIKDTMMRYLRSVRPLLDDSNYEKVVRQAEEFQNGIGKKLQWYLWLKSWWSNNFVSDWWEQYVYLRGRSPLMVNSNFYATDYLKVPTTNQTARAASAIYLLIQFRRRLERQEITPILGQGFVPLCSWQYERIFNTARVPGVECDKIVHYENSNHIVVLHNGCYYKLLFFYKGRFLNAPELKFQLDQIIARNETSSHGEKYLASLTSWNRTKWAQAREKYFVSGHNKKSLKIVESAAFFITLDDQPLEYDTEFNSEKFDEYVAQCLHGKVNDRWFDKSFNICFGSNGRLALNAEHTWADAPVMGYTFEDACADDLHSYDANGLLKGRMEIAPPLPTRIKWEINDDLVKTIDEAYSDGLKLIKDVDHKLVAHKAFGKGFIKTCRLSPDAYIQMALQLAYYRDYGKFSLTYEASMTRLFREGRTETVRPCTIESAAWVKAMENANSTTAERMKLLQDACKQHQQGYLNAMCGRGIDRHIFCLYVVSRYLEVESPFLKDAISEPWRLSTSQTPYGQSPKIDLKKNPELMTPGGGFGPVSFDGYAVSYIIVGEDSIFFHLSSMKSCEITNTARFGERIFKAMNDIKILFEEHNASHKKS